MLSFKQFIKEELNQAQKNKVNSWLPYIASGAIYSPKAEEISGHIIRPGRHHIVIPAVAHVLRAVHGHLDKHGYTNHDYVNGITTDKHGRQVSIGKALEKTKAPEQLKDDFANDDRKHALKVENSDIIISRHPYHVAEASTKKPWTSCAGLTPSGKFCSYGNGAAARKLPDEIKHGTHVAYLVPKLKPDEEPDDTFNGAQKRINKATARIYLKPHISEQSGHTVIVPENKVYSKSITGKNLGFLRTTEQFTNQHFPLRNGEVYKKAPVYDDDGTHNKPKFNTNDESLDKLQNQDSSVRETLYKSSNLTKEQLHKLIDNAHEDDLHHIAGNPNLDKSHIKKLYNKNNARLNYNLMLTSEQSKNSKHFTPEMKDELHKRIIDTGNVQHLMVLPQHTTLSKENLHGLISKTIDHYNRFTELGIKPEDQDPEGLRNVINGITRSKNPIDQDHVNQLFNSNNKFIHANLARNNLLSIKQLEQAANMHKQDYRNLPANINSNIRYSHPLNDILSKWYEKHKRIHGNENVSIYDFYQDRR